MENYGNAASNLGGPTCGAAKAPAPMSLTEQLSRQEESIRQLQQGLDEMNKRVCYLEQRVGTQESPQLPPGQ